MLTALFQSQCSPSLSLLIQEQLDSLPFLCSTGKGFFLSSTSASTRNSQRKVGSMHQFVHSCQEVTGTNPRNCSPFHQRGSSECSNFLLQGAAFST